MNELRGAFAESRCCCRLILGAVGGGKQAPRLLPTLPLCIETGARQAHPRMRALSLACEKSLTRSADDVSVRPLTELTISSSTHVAVTEMA
jgi:hypothetical protein